MAQSRHDQLVAQIDPGLLGQWETEQLRLKGYLIETDAFEWDLGTLQCVGGVDISANQHTNEAVASLVVLEFPSFSVMYENSMKVVLDQPYVPGFLAFREVSALHSLLQCAAVKPQVVLVDGNGILHSRGFGLASHLGVLTDTPTIGVGKKIFAVDGVNQVTVNQVSQGLAGGSSVELVGNSGRVWGAALRSTSESLNPIFVSIGHKISLPTALEVVKACCFHRVPEPIRLADKLSRRLVES